VQTLRNLRNVLFVRNMLNALIVIGAFLALIWIVQVVNWVDGYRLNQEYMIFSRDPGRMGDIFTAPFLHGSWTHIEANSLPLLVLGVAAAYRGIRRFLVVTAIVTIVSGLTVWLIGDNAVGASGVIFGYFGYVLVRGIFDRNLLDIAIGIGAGVMYWGILAVVLPGHPGISWQGHLGGLIGGFLAAWLLRTHRAPRQAAADAPVSRFGGWTWFPPQEAPGGGGLAGRDARGRRTVTSGSVRRHGSGGAPGTRPVAGSTAADDLLRQLDDMGF
jgi:membrane associated rhomboid family serine protease